MRISDWSSDVCSSDLFVVWPPGRRRLRRGARHGLVGDRAPHLQCVDRCCDVVHAQQRRAALGRDQRSEEHTSELQSLMRISYAVFCLKKKRTKITIINNNIV